MKTTQLFFLLAICFLINSCGIISSTRYGNGLKLNIFENWGREYDDKKVVKENKKTIEINEEDQAEITSVDEIGNNAISENIVPEEVKLISENSLNTIQENLNQDQAQIVLRPTQEIIRNTNEPRQNYEERRMDPISTIAGILFYGSLILTIIFALLEILTFLLTIPFVLGFILAFVSLNRIKKSNGYYAGRGLNKSIIVVFIVITLLLSLLISVLIAYLIS